MKKGNLFGLVNEPPRFKSNHNLSEAAHFTSHVGQVRPFFAREVFAGDKFSIQPSLYVESFPTEINFRGKIDARVDYFFVPFKDFYGWAENDSKMTFEQYINMPVFTASPVSSSYPSKLTGLGGYFPAAYAPGSLMDMLGHPTIPEGNFGKVISNDGDLDTLPTGRSIHAYFDAGPFLSFWSIYRDFYLNPQETSFPVCQFLADSWSTVKFDIRALDYLPALCRTASMYPNKMQAYPRTDIFASAKLLFPSGTGLENSGENPEYIQSFLSSLSSASFRFDGGIPLCTYKMDYFRGRLNSSTGSYSAEVESEDGITINNIRFANKLQKLADRFTPTSGRFSDFLRAIWPVKTHKTHGPMYLGGTGVRLTFDSILQTAPGIEDGTPMGWKVQRIQSQGDGKYIHCKVTTPGWILGIYSSRPQLTYDHYIWPESVRLFMGDKYHPDMANLGYEPLPNYEVAPGAMVTTKPGINQTESIGIHLPWVDLRTAVDHTHGLFRWPYSLCSMFPNYYPGERPNTYAGVYGPLDYTTYVHPRDWNSPFAATGPLDHNFLISVYQIVKARRPVPYTTTPSL